MIFLDTNVLVDMLEPQETDLAIWSRETLSVLAEQEELLTNVVVLAELAGQLDDSRNLLGTLAEANVTVLDLDASAALRAARAYREYRSRGGRREVILPDFLIAAQAAALNTSFMTRDRRLASYFPELTLITPETHPNG